MDKVAETEVPTKLPEDVADVGTPLHWEDALTAVRKTRLTRPKTVVMCGFAYPSRAYAPYDKRTVEIWGCNESYTANYMMTSDGKFRADRWFQMHAAEDWGRKNNPNDPHHPEWVKAKKNFPLVMQEQPEGGAKVDIFPREEIDALFFNNLWVLHKRGKAEPWLDAYGHGYYSSSLSYMLAYACWQKKTGQVDWENLDLYGFHTGSKAEFIGQKPGIEHWLRAAMELGMNVRIEGSSTLLSAPLYGYGVSDVLLPSHVQERIEYLEEAIVPLREDSTLRHGARLAIQELNQEYGDQLPDLLGHYHGQFQEELVTTCRVNFFEAALEFSRQLQIAMVERHGKEATGWVDRMTLELHVARLRDQVEEARAELEQIQGALLELRRVSEQYEEDPERVASFKLRETSLMNALVRHANFLSRLYGKVSQLHYYLARAEGRTLNWLDDHDFGFIVLPDLFGTRDILNGGQNGEKGKEATEAQAAQ